MLFTFIAIGQSNYLGLGFTTLNWKLLYWADLMRCLSVFSGCDWNVPLDWPNVTDTHTVGASSEVCY